MLIQFLTIIFLIFTHGTNGEFNVISMNPNGSISSAEMTNFSLEIDRPVNRPNFSSLIRIFSVSLNSTVLTIDVSLNSSNVTYSNRKIQFSLKNFILNSTNNFSILLDGGVLFSNSSVNSSAKISTDFWPFHLKDLQIESTTEKNPTISTEFFSGSTTKNSNGTRPVNTVEPTTHNPNTTRPTNTAEQTSQNFNTTRSTSSTTTKILGEAAPSRSAQWGIGIGITLISIIILGEIIYFKFFYFNYGRSGNYST